MNGVHDMGGQQGHGPVRIEANEPLFHGEWERRALGVTVAMGASGLQHRPGPLGPRIPAPARLRARPLLRHLDQGPAKHADRARPDHR